MRKPGRAFVRASALAVAFVLGAPSSATIAATGGTYGDNLVVNGDAEAELGAPDNTKVVKPSGWTTTGHFTAVMYGASGGFPDAMSPGPPERGKSLFEGGNAAKSTGTQSISLVADGADIDAGAVTFAFSGWVGGYASQGDFATVSVDFAGAGGAKLGRTVLPSATAASRRSVTGLVHESASGTVPKGARSAIVTIVLTRVDGEYDDGSADDISLVLTKKP